MPIFRYFTRDGAVLHEKTERLRGLMAASLKFPVTPSDAARSALELGLDRLIETYESGAVEHLRHPAGVSPNPDELVALRAERDALRARVAELEGLLTVGRTAVCLGCRLLNGDCDEDGLCYHCGADVVIVEGDGAALVEALTPPVVVAPELFPAPGERYPGSAIDDAPRPEWWRRMEAAGIVRCEDDGIWFGNGTAVVWPLAGGRFWGPGGIHPTEEAACLAHLAAIGAP